MFNISDAKESPMIQLPEAFLHDIPKTDLHVHLDGSLRIETLIELAQERNIPLPAYEPLRLKEILNIGGIHENLESYLRVFDTTNLVLQDEDALTRTAYELAEDAALENCRYIEVRYCPLLHQRNGLSLPVIVESVAAGLRMAKKKYGIMSGQIICALRHLPPQTSLRLAELAVAFKNKGVVGFDLAGGEINNPAERHAEAFAYVRKNNLNSTVHAGEAYGPRSIHQAIHECNAHRIGHGTRLRENGDLLNYINDHRIPLEVCLKSNVQTAAVDAIENHPLKFYMDFGLRITLNTDNRLVTDTTLTEEYKLACQIFHLTYDEVKRLVVDGFKSAFMPFRKKREVMRLVLDEFEQVSQKYGLKSEVAMTGVSRYAIDRVGEDPMPD
ncbi:MAG: adenosine deaminase [Proteobacteria bacterium]|nr:adenosine deaminase [Pseudomonadota bacterium]MBQ4359674.1 adenosine deaminase [Pseudomonadota bacterium]